MDRVIGPLGDLVMGDLRFSTFDFRFSKSANWFILSPNSADNRWGEVWAARLVVSVQGCRLSAFRLCLFLLTRHLSLRLGSVHRLIGSSGH